MGYTTFTGPVRAGNILDTWGTLPGVDVSNVGQVVMAQSAAVAEGVTPAPSTISGLTTICIPGGSTILGISFAVTTAFTNSVSIGGTTDGATVSATYFADPTALAAGITAIGTTTPAQVLHWLGIDTAGPPVVVTSDTQIVVAGGLTAGPGRGVLTVTYLQGPNGNT